MTDSPLKYARASTGSPLAELLRLAAPIILMTSTRMLMGFIDFLMVSAMGETAAQAAISPASITVFGIACVGMGIATAVQTFVAQVAGRGESRRAGSYAWQAIYIALVGGVLAIPLILTAPDWYRVLADLGDHAPEVAALEIRYVEIAMWFIAPSIICAGLDGFFSGVQQPRISLYAAVAALAVNALGNWLFIFGPTIPIPFTGLELHFPAWGIAGAAVATVIGWCVRAGVLLMAMLAPAFDRPYHTRRAFAPAWDKLRGLLRVGGPTSVQWIIDIGSWVVFIVLIMPPFGVAAMAATNIAIQYMHLSFMPAIGVGIALCSQVGFAIGQGRPERAMQRVRVAFAVTGVYMGIIGLTFVVGRAPLMQLLNNDPAVVAAGSWILTWAAIFQVFDAMGITYMNALRGAGDTRWPAIVTAILCWGVFICGGYWLSHYRPEWGINAPWATCTLYIVLLGLLLAWRWYTGRWRAIRLFAEPRAAAAIGAALPGPERPAPLEPLTPLPLAEQRIQDP